MLNALVEEPPDSWYAKLTLEHERNTDTFLWRLLAKGAKRGIRVAGGAGTLPLDSVVDSAPLLISTCCDCQRKSQEPLERKFAKYLESRDCRLCECRRRGGNAPPGHSGGVAEVDPRW